MTRGICRVCHAPVKLNRMTGLVRQHKNKRFNFKIPCDGSGKPPCVLEKLKQGEKSDTR